MFIILISTANTKEPEHYEMKELIVSTHMI